MNAPHPVREFKHHGLVEDFSRPGVRFERRPARTPDGKVAEGLDAIRWWREGKIRQIAEYCCFDVKVTRLVHEYGAAHGELFYDDHFGSRVPMTVDWKLS